jgi:hypothetical protein
LNFHCFSILYGHGEVLKYFFVVDTLVFIFCYAICCQVFVDDEWNLLIHRQITLYSILQCPQAFQTVQVVNSITCIYIQIILKCWPLLCFSLLIVYLILINYIITLKETIFNCIRTTDINLRYFYCQMHPAQ